MKDKGENAMRHCISEKIPLQRRMHLSILNQSSRLSAFFLRILNHNEQKHWVIEENRCYESSSGASGYTSEQKLVVFMFDSKQASKIFSRDGWGD